MAETEFPTTDELLEMAPAIVGDLTSALDELVRRLEAHLPDLIEAENTAREWTGTWREIPAPRGIEWMPNAGLNAAYVGKILIGAASESVGMGNAFRTEHTVTVFWIQHALKDPNQVRVHWRLGELVRIALFPYHTGCRNADDYECWAELYPLTLSLLPEEFEDYAGLMLTYRLMQRPNAN